MSGRYPDWATLGPQWPHHEASRFVEAGGYRWHVQEMGLADKAAAPVCLLIHGTGAATHSWRGLMPLLAARFRVVAMDLPGHGFTTAQRIGRVTLPGMAASVWALMDALGFAPQLIVGHSAGAAIGAQMLIGMGGTTPLIGVAPALMPFPGLAAKLFPSLARILFTNPFTAIIFSRLASGPGETARFLRRATGSTIDADGLRCYEQLFGTSGHCDGAIRMMANWDLERLHDQLPQLAAPTLLVRAGGDKAILASAIDGAAALIPGAVIEHMPKLGHLAHEEDAGAAATIVFRFAQRHGLVGEENGDG
jgi:magnesium chelatase accessory protein